ncbi:MAG: ROK family protein, partial [Candidatus Zixiibacteriota bacterium]
EIGGTLSGRLSMPVAVENDARAMALAELRVGAAQGAHSAICMTVGTGIGGGIILDGKLWRGHSQSAGEIGHAVIDIDGELGDDGLPGSLESLAAAPAIQRRVRRELEKTMTQVFEEKLAGASLDTLTARQVFEALDLADPVATRALQDTAFILGSGLTGLVNAINPERVIIGGGVSDAAPSLAPLVEAQIRRSALSSAVSDLRVLKAELGNQAGFIGAAFLSTEEPWRSQLQRDSNKKSKVER